MSRRRGRAEGACLKSQAYLPELLVLVTEARITSHT